MNLKKFDIIDEKSFVCFKLNNIKDKTERMITYNNIILKNLKNLNSGKTIMIVNENKNGGLMVGLEKNIKRDKNFIKKQYMGKVDFYNKEKINNGYYNVLLNIKK